MADNIISGIHEQASMLPGHRMKWKKRGVSVTDTFTYEDMTVQVTYDTDYRPLNGPPGVRSWATSIRLHHPDLDLQNVWSESGLGTPPDSSVSGAVTWPSTPPSIGCWRPPVYGRPARRTFLWLMAPGAGTTPWHSVTTALKLSLPAALRMRIPPARRMLA